MDNKVSYRKLHGSSPVLYNIYGTMTSIVPLLGESHTFQGVAFVDVANMQLATGDDQLSAFRAYQQLLTTSGQELTPEKDNNIREVSGVVDRFAGEVRDNATIYYLHLRDVPHVFTASGDVSPKLPLTEVGDKVNMTYLSSSESVIPVIKFDNAGISLISSAAQKAVENEVAERDSVTRANQDLRDAKGMFRNLTKKQLLQLLDLQKKMEQKKK